jgi:alanyl-tRNA synthetase
MKAAEIRKKFAEFFISSGHEKISSSSIIPHNDPTIMFANAGMNQFKDYFTGKANAKNKRAVTIQKCVRAGGKHNDLDNVGFTPRHHTFFEMLGNFSFGDYFKEDAIKYAWEFLTSKDWMGINQDKLYITVHYTDKEAREIWKKVTGFGDDRIFDFGDKDNFWEMGEVGPCGPCSEIFYDYGEKHSQGRYDTSECIIHDEDRYIEIWNLVFMQYEKYKEGDEIKQRELPKPSIDTGAGLERVAAAINESYSNYLTDDFKIIKNKMIELGADKSEKLESFRNVVADHIRCTTMLITDGVIPSNEGRGYVLRRIIRRAVRHAEELGFKETILYKLVPTVFELLGDEYPENKANQALAEKYLKLEEETFRKTLKTGMELLSKELKGLKAGDTLKGETVFKLYDTYGFPADLTEIISQENKIEVDMKGFEVEMEKQKERSRKAGDFSAQGDNLKAFYKIKEDHGATDFLGYKQTQSLGKLIAIEDLGEVKALVFDRTPFYGESGGQAGDSGFILDSDRKIAEIVDTQKPVDGLHVHIVKDTSNLKAGNNYQLVVDDKARGLTARNHTATHLLQAALIEVLGDHIKQAGSFVGPERLRFDFTHPEAVTKEQLREVEKLVNNEINKSTDVCAEVMTKDQAMKKGATALFGEKYGNEVRVIDIPGFSIELCGGTHVANTNEIGLFNIVTETSLSAGVRRIEALSSEGAIQRVETRMKTLDELEALLKVKGEKAIERIEQFMNDIKTKNKEIKELKEKLQSASSDDLFKDTQEIKGGLTYKAIQAPEGTDIRKLGDLYLSKFPKGVCLITSSKGDKASVLLKTFKGNGDINCSNILKDVLSALGGRGGGKPDMAQGSCEANQISELETKVMTNLA